jgi:hypothetical protein
VSNLLFEFIREELKFIKHAKGGARYKSTGASGFFSNLVYIASNEEVIGEL